MLYFIFNIYSLNKLPVPCNYLSWLVIFLKFYRYLEYFSIWSHNTAVTLNVYNFDDIVSLFQQLCKRQVYIC